MLIREMDEKLQFPGLTNTWTMPVTNRLEMEMTGIKTAVGIKIQGPELGTLQDIGARMQQVLAGMPETSTAFAERVSQGFYLNVDVDRAEAARYGLTVADVQRVISSEIGGMNIAQNVEGRQRFQIAVRYERGARNSPDDVSQALISTPGGEQIPIGQVARISFSRGPAMIRDEDGALTAYVYLNLKTHDYGGYVERAEKALRDKVAVPPGYSWHWAGEYEFQQHAKERLRVIVPIVFAVIFLLLYLVFKSVTEAAVLIFPTLYAVSGGLLLQWWMGYNFSVAVWVGYIALFGIAVETGVVMVVYLHEALENKRAATAQMTAADVEQATIEGAVQRLRPKLMTVTAVILSLAPILWESGIGSDVMKPIAAPIIGGMITSTIHVLILVPVFFMLMKRRELRHARVADHEQEQSAERPEALR
jgi:Cu(I)/Ag(I) efflux system membrane protein CusA/SilA